MLIHADTQCYLLRLFVGLGMRRLVVKTLPMSDAPVTFKIRLYFFPLNP